MNKHHPEFLADVETFLANTGMGPAYFGKLAAGNSELVGRLRNGRRVYADTEERVRAFMASYSPSSEQSVESSATVQGGTQ